MPAIPGNVIIMLSEEAVLCSHYAQLCNGILPLTQGLGQATCCKWLHATVNPSISEKLPLCIMQFLDNYRYLKGANEVNRVFSASCAIMLAKSTVLCWNMLLCCMYHIMPKIMLA